jgi:hypothetical protein
MAATHTAQFFSLGLTLLKIFDGIRKL